MRGEHNGHLPNMRAIQSNLVIIARNLCTLSPSMHSIWWMVFSFEGEKPNMMVRNVHSCISIRARWIGCEDSHCVRASAMQHADFQELSIWALHVVTWNANPTPCAFQTKVVPVAWRNLRSVTGPCWTRLLFTGVLVNLWTTEIILYSLSSAKVLWSHKLLWGLQSFSRPYVFNLAG